MQRVTGDSFVGDPYISADCRAEHGRRAILSVYSVKHQGNITIRYLSCNRCGRKPVKNKLVVEEVEDVAELQPINR